MHIPDDPLFYEKFLFHARRPRLQGLADAVWQDRRADLLGPVVSRGGAFDGDAGGGNPFLPTAIRLASQRKGQYGIKQHGAWETIQRAHAVANGCYVAVVNRTGHEVLDGVGGDGLEFWARVLWLERRAKSSPRPVRTRRRF